MILDTNALSAIADGDRDLEPILEAAAVLALPVIALGEYRYGIRQSRHRAKYEKWLEILSASCQVLEVDEATTESYASLRLQLKRAGRSIPANDVWIAALARQHAMPVLSRDNHFDSVAGLHRIDW